MCPIQIAHSYGVSRWTIWRDALGRRSRASSNAARNNRSAFKCLRVLTYAKWTFARTHLVLFLSRCRCEARERNKFLRNFVWFLLVVTRSFRVSPFVLFSCPWNLASCLESKCYGRRFVIALSVSEWNSLTVQGSSLL